jgi:hypothetical protein
MRRNSDLKADIEKIKKLKALQAKATDKLNRITDAAAGKPPKKKAAPAKKSAVKSQAKPVRKKKAKAPVKKGSLWKKLFGKKPEKKHRGKAKKGGRKR